MAGVLFGLRVFTRKEKTQNFFFREFFHRRKEIVSDSKKKRKNFKKLCINLNGATGGLNKKSLSAFVEPDITTQVLKNKSNTIGLT